MWKLKNPLRFCTILSIWQPFQALKKQLHPSEMGEQNKRYQVISTAACCEAESNLETKRLDRTPENPDQLLRHPRGSAEKRLKRVESQRGVEWERWRSISTFLLQTTSAHLGSTSLHLFLYLALPSRLFSIAGCYSNTFENCCRVTRHFWEEAKF